MLKYTLSQCMQMLAINNHRLKRMLAAANIMPETSSTDARIRLITEAQFAELRAVHLAAPRITRDETSDLQEQINKLTARVAALEGRRGPSRPAPKRDETNTTSTNRGSLPAGYVGWREWGRMHNIPKTTLSNAIEAGRLTVIEDQWEGTQVRQALDAERQRTAYALWGNAERFNPCDQCPDQHG